MSYGKKEVFSFSQPKKKVKETVENSIFSIYSNVCLCLCVCKKFGLILKGKS